MTKDQLYSTWVLTILSFQRIVEVGTNLLRLSSPISPTQTEAAGAGYPGLCAVRLLIPPRMKTSQPLWDICFSAWPCWQKKKNIFCVHMEFPVLQLVPIASYSLTWHHWDKSGSIFLKPPRIGHLYMLMRFTFPPTFSSSGWVVPSLSAFPCIRCSSLFTILVALCWTCPRKSVSCAGIPRTRDSRWRLTSVKQRGITFP